MSVRTVVSVALGPVFFLESNNTSIFGIVIGRLFRALGWAAGLMPLPLSAARSLSLVGAATAAAGEVRSRPLV